MELVPKQGWIFVEEVVAEGGLELHDGFVSGKVSSGIKEQGMIVFYRESLNFNGNLRLVKIDDVLAWIKPEVVADEPEVDNA